MKESIAKEQLSVASPFKLRSASNLAETPDPGAHLYRNKVICGTESRGYERPRNRSREEIVVDASEGFIPLWAKDVTLRWRFQERSLRVFENPEAAKSAIEVLFGKALLAWGDAAPVKFSKRDDAWDFEVVVRKNDDCDMSGCVLASAFFPDAGRHELVIYPQMFQQSEEEQVETLVHEIGHIFGLRHFFAKVKEKAWPAEIFGKHDPFTIMNYGAQSKLTNNDKSDLTKLYQLVWSGEQTEINKTPIRLVSPYHAI